MARVIDWIEAKKDGEALPADAIREVVAGYTSGRIPDYQMSALLMAIAIRGMTAAETLELTRAMIASGSVLDLSAIPGVKLDKHSTGGVGDKVTLAFVPIVAAAGIAVAKMSGHGLGLTGGTLDKLETIPGLRTQLSEGEIVEQVSSIGACICSQSDSLAPADRAIYALRDVTGTVASVPLIASSIMSKKIACNADAIILDVKVGSGAFMKDIAQARELADACLGIARSFGKRMSVFLTDMDQPLGRAVGNDCEVREVIELLQGRTVDSRLNELTTVLCAEAFRLAEIGAEPAELIESGRAYTKFAQIVEAQGGRLEAAPPRASEAQAVSRQTGHVQRIDAAKIAELAAALGAGREKKGDSIDPLAGVFLHKVYGDPVSTGELLGTIASSDPARVSGDTARLLRDAFTIGPDRPQPRPLILDHITLENLESEPRR